MCFFTRNLKWIFLQLFDLLCVLVLCAKLLSIMASPGQRKGVCGHIMASFDQHSRCARCQDKGQGDDACVRKLPCNFCELLTPEQVLQLSTPTYKIRKEKKQEREALVDPGSVTVLSPVDQDKSVGDSSSINTSQDLSLPQPYCKKDLQDLDKKWSLRMARLEALITMGQRPQHATFSPVKAPVSHAPPAVSLSQAPFLLSAIPSGQARICKPAVANSHPPSRPIAQDTLCKWEKSAKETSYVCNQAAGFNRCITKIQDSVQEHLKSLQAELSKGKSSSKAQAALDELHYLASFNQNVSFAIGKSLQHLSDFIFVQMANLTLTRRDSYLENLKTGV